MSNKNLILSALFVISLVALGSVLWVNNVGINFGASFCTTAPVLSSVKGEKRCRRIFMMYNSSKLEERWVKHLSEWGPRPCEQTRKEMDEVMTWIDTTSRQDAKKIADLTGKIFSWFTYRLECDGEEPRIIEESIEPLASVLRDPRGVCDGFPPEDIGSLKFLILGKPWVPKQKIVLIDFGASLWASGGGRASQNWFWEEYLKIGFEFQGMYMFEVTHHSLPEIYNPVPRDLLPRFHYYNFPISPEPNAQFHAWTFVDNIPRRGDEYVAVKLDIDTQDVEEKLVEELISPGYADRVPHEFFFEHHVGIPEMQKFWGKCRGTVQDTYKIFLNLRQKGVRAHAWP